MEIDLNYQTLPTVYALDSATRIDIINLLAHNKLTVTELANELHYSKAIISKHLQILKAARIVVEAADSSGDRRLKRFTVVSDNILINLPEKSYSNFNTITYEITLGNYFSNQGIMPTCGLANKEHIIGTVDDPNVFLTAERSTASLLWFSQGQVEYIVPNPYKDGRTPELIEISLELSSEFPVSNNNWPSEISFWVNDIKFGTWLAPGNFSDVRGRLTPEWWESNFSQYGLLKHLRIMQDKTTMDGTQLSKHTLGDLQLDTTNYLHFRVGIDPTSLIQGGLTIFGREFGNHPQDIRMICYYSDS